MNSPGHRANILNPSFTQIGIGVRANAQGVLYFTQEFGQPSAVAPPPGSSITPPAPTPTPASTRPSETAHLRAIPSAAPTRPSERVRSAATLLARAMSH